MLQAQSHCGSNCSQTNIIESDSDDDDNSDVESDDVVNESEINTLETTKTIKCYHISKKATQLSKTTNK